MKKNITLLLALFWFICQIKCQVVNDDCNSSINLGFVNNRPNVGPYNFNCFDGVAWMDTGFYYNSTINALVNIPYPNMTIPCYGFATNVSSLANDVWYKVSGVSCDFEFTFSCSDTTHMSIWTGESCTTLCAVNCYTFLPGTYFHDTVFSVGNHPVYFQICGSGVNKFISNMNLCLEGSIQNCQGANQICSTVYTDICEVETDDNLNVYPNPAKTVLNIRFEKSSSYNLTLFSIDGRMVMNEKSNSEHHVLNIASLDKGIYLLKVSDNNRSKIVKVVIQ